jgi:circadian clock protein KaiB
MSADAQPHWHLTLYVSGASPNSAAALDTVRRLCDKELPGQVDLEVVDVLEQPALVLRDDIVAIPTLVKKLPPPLRALVGDLSDTARLRIGLDLPPATHKDGEEQTP